MSGVAELEVTVLISSNKLLISVLEVAVYNKSGTINTELMNADYNRFSIQYI